MTGSRRKSRILAFQAIYSWDFNRESIEKLNRFDWIESEKENIKPETIMFARLLLNGTLENIKTVDKIIKRHTDNWKFERISKVDLAILRISIYSLIYQKDIAGNITIDEAIDISRKYSSNDSYRFVNGVLDSVYKEIHKKLKPVRTVKIIKIRHKKPKV